MKNKKGWILDTKNFIADIQLLSDSLTEKTDINDALREYSFLVQKHLKKEK